MEKETTIAILAQIFSKLELCVISNRLADACEWHREKKWDGLRKETWRIREIFSEAYEKASETDYYRF